MIPPRHLMNKRATVIRSFKSNDDMGGQSVSNTTFGPFPCRRRQPIVAVEGDNAQADVANVTDVVYFMPGTDIRRNDALYVGTDILDVHAVYAPSDSVYLRADCLSRQQ